VRSGPSNGDGGADGDRVKADEQQSLHAAKKNPRRGAEEEHQLKIKGGSPCSHDHRRLRQQTRQCLADEDQAENMDDGCQGLAGRVYGGEGTAGYSRLSAR